VKLLLDTHIALWAITDDPVLGDKATRLIGDPDNELFVSSVSILEIAIKRTRRPESLAISAEEVRRKLDAAGYRFLDVSAVHAAAVETLPLVHGDPFDRLLVAQALSEPLRLVTRDRAVAAYSDTIILV
jgi:PIN domain nuclease of toxin-antitoxin system